MFPPLRQESNILHTFHALFSCYREVSRIFDHLQLKCSPRCELCTRADTEGRCDYALGQGSLFCVDNSGFVGLAAFEFYLVDVRVHHSGRGTRLIIFYCDELLALWQSRGHHSPGFQQEKFLVHHL